ncbi:histidine phosphatase family protein [Pauljensenia sp. 20925_1_27]
MPTLVLVRHAQAAYSYPDHVRPLTQAGLDQAVRLGGALSREVGVFDVAVCSDATRAQQTFEQIRQRVQIRDSWFDRGVYNADDEDILTLARTFEGDRALIVGHEPTISGAGYVLAREDDRGEVARGVPTATAVILTFDGTWEDLAPTSCTLRVLFTPPTR